MLSEASVKVFLDGGWGVDALIGRETRIHNDIDLLQNYTATTMLANSEFVALLKQANTDSSKMAEVIGVSEAQLRFVTNTASGMGLIKCGSVVIPFDNQISKDTDLYRLYNTNIHEKIAEQKKREMQNNVE